MNKNFFSKKNILITGNTGFKGSWLTKVLLKFNANIIGYSNTENISNPNLFKILNLKKKIKFIKGDIKDKKKLDNVFKKYRPSIIFHLAAQPIVSESYKKPFETILVNVIGSLNILDLCKKHQFVRSLIYVTSDKCYENVETIYGYKENDKLGGSDPYSASKSAAENIFSAYLKSFFLKKFGSASVRAGNVIGGGDWSKDRLIPDFIRSLNKNKKMIIRNPSSVRPWQHVLDPILGYIELAEKLYLHKEKFSGSWNFGPNFDANVPTLEVVRRMNKNIPKKVKIAIDKKKSKNFESKLLRLNCDKAINYLSWRPSLNTLESIDYTIQWYKKYLEKKNIEKFTDIQIAKIINKHYK